MQQTQTDSLAISVCSIQLIYCRIYKLSCDFILSLFRGFTKQPSLFHPLLCFRCNLKMDKNRYFCPPGFTSVTHDHESSLHTHIQTLCCG